MTSLKYFDYLFKGITHRGEQLSDFKVTQLHLSRGTPSFLDKSQLARLMAHLEDNFRFTAEYEASIEINPGEIKLRSVDDLAQQIDRRVGGQTDENILQLSLTGSNLQYKEINYSASVKPTFYYAVFLTKGLIPFYPD
jgi:hypothetical protein